MKLPDRFLEMAETPTRRMARAQATLNGCVHLHVFHMEVLQHFRLRFQDAGIAFRRKTLTRDKRGCGELTPFRRDRLQPVPDGAFAGEQQHETREAYKEIPPGLLLRRQARQRQKSSTYLAFLDSFTYPSGITPC